MRVLEEINRIWTGQFSQHYSERSRLIKEFRKDGTSLRALFDPERARYYEENKHLVSADECPFDEEPEQGGWVSGETLCYFINIFPYFERHFLGFPDEHREHPKKQDLIEFIDLLGHTDHVGFLNLRGSGAGIPDHVHYQGIIAELPIDRAKSRIITAKSGFSIENIDYPSFALKLKLNSDRGRDECIERVLGYEKPFNLLIYPRHIYFVPRTEEYSSQVPGWKIAAAEVGGLFVLRSEQAFNEANYDMLETILKETTVQDRGAQIEIEESLAG